MIKGFAIRVEGAELQRLLAERAEYHRERAKIKAEELAKLREVADKLMPDIVATNLSHMNKFSSGGGYGADPQALCEHLENDIRTHRNKELAFGFYSQHVFQDVYELTIEDLRSIEIAGLQR